VKKQRRDLAHVTGTLQVRHATADEDYLAFSGEHERPRRA
jgi:hypothetical protein